MATMGSLCLRLCPTSSRSADHDAQAGEDEPADAEERILVRHRLFVQVRLVDMCKARAGRRRQPLVGLGPLGKTIALLSAGIGEVERGTRQHHLMKSVEKSNPRVSVRQVVGRHDLQVGSRRRRRQAIRDSRREESRHRFLTSVRTCPGTGRLLPRDVPRPFADPKWRLVPDRVAVSPAPAE